jgi:hypothetical protein
MAPNLSLHVAIWKPGALHSQAQLGEDDFLFRKGRADDIFARGAENTSTGFC